MKWKIAFSPIEPHQPREKRKWAQMTTELALSQGVENREQKPFPIPIYAYHTVAFLEFFLE